MKSAFVVFVVFVEANTSGTGALFVERAREAGYRPRLLARDPARFPWAVPDETTVVDTTDVAAVEAACRALAGEGRVAAVLSTSDYFVATAATVARALGLPGADPRAVARCRNKARQRGVLQGVGVPAPWHGLARTGAEASLLAARNGLPVVVKPVGGSGSQNVAFCDDLLAVADHANRIETQGRAEILVESYMQGPEYSVELFHGRAVAVTAKHTGALPHFVETGHDVGVSLPGEEERALVGTAVRAVEALGLGWGPNHVELRLVRPGAAFVVEVNPRLAGGYIPELVRLSTGIDLISATLEAALGNSPRLGSKGTPDAGPGALRSASIRFVMAERPGTFAGLAVAPEVRGSEGVVDVRAYRRAGDPVAVHGDFRDRLGHVIAVDRDALGSAARAERALRGVRVVLKEGS